MRRLWAFLLLAVLSFPLALPVVFAESHTTLPECCRRGGAHHCAMAEMVSASPSDSDGPIAATARAKCPYYPTGGISYAGAQTLLASATFRFECPAVRRIRREWQRRSYSRVCFHPSEPTRGPPTQSRIA